MAEAWVCPQCQARWHAQNGWCAGCGYGMAPQTTHPANGATQPLPVAGGIDSLASLGIHLPQEAAAPYAQVGSAADSQAVQGQLAQAWELAQTAQRQAQEMRSVMEKMTQERAGLLQGFQQMLQPLAEWFARERGMQVSVQQLIPVTLQTLQALSAHAQRQVAVQQSGQATTQLSTLEQAMGRLAQTIEALRVQLQQPVNGPEHPQPYLQNDAQLAAMEQQMLAREPQLPWSTGR